MLLRLPPGEPVFSIGQWNLPGTAAPPRGRQGVSGSTGMIPACVFACGVFTFIMALNKQRGCLLIIHVFYLSVSCFYNKQRDFLKWVNVPSGLVVRSGQPPHPHPPNESKLDYSEELSFPVAFPRKKQSPKKQLKEFLTFMKKSPVIEFAIAGSDFYSFIYFFELLAKIWDASGAEVFVQKGPGVALGKQLSAVPRL